MPVQRKQRRQPDNENECLGLMANGSSGDWEVAVDETTKGPGRWFVQLEGPSVYFSFEVPSPKMIFQALNFLEGRSSPQGPQARSSAENGSLALGKHRQTSVALVRDDECKGRYFLVVGQEADLVVRYTITGKDLGERYDPLLSCCSRIGEKDVRSHHAPAATQQPFQR